MSRDYHDTKSHPTIPFEDHIKYCELDAAEAEFARRHATPVGMRSRELISAGLAREFLRDYGMIDAQGRERPDILFGSMLQVEAGSHRVICFVPRLDFIDLAEPAIVYKG